MIQLFINNILAVPKNDTNFKVSLENQFFTKTSSYTFEIELPMNILANVKIYGAMHRKDVAKSRVALPARLVADNITILTGIATITSVNESSIKIQLLGESSKYKYGNANDYIYIDELPLGDWLVRSFGSYPGMPQEYKGSTFLMLAHLATKRAIDYSTFASWMFNDVWVAYPIYNSNAETVCNGYVIRQFMDRYDLPFSLPDGQTNATPQMKLAIQPFVWYMCQLIAEATGRSLDINDNYLYQNEFYRRIFIANANINVECNQCLPHWTINEWWDQIEKTFGVKMIIDDKTGNIKLYKFDNALMNNSMVVINSIDDYSTELTEDSSHEDSLTQNVGFADNDALSRQDKLSDEILDFSNIKKFDSYADLKNYLATTNHSNVESWNLIFECEGRQYIFKNTNQIMEVNYFRNRILSNKTDIDVTLKFVPCSYTSYTARVCNEDKSASGIYIDTVVGQREVQVLTRPDKANFSWLKSENDLTTPYDTRLSDMIFEDAEIPDKEEKQDLCYIAIHGVTPSSWPRALIREVAYSEGESKVGSWGDLEYIDKGMSLSLIPIEGQYNLASETISTQFSKINTAIKHCYKFVADTIPDTNAIFIIDNKKYLCEKLEVSFSNRGLDKLITGYFFAIDN